MSRPKIYDMSCRDQKQIDLQQEFIKIIKTVGIKSRIISQLTGIGESRLSRFKTGKTYLSTYEFDNLNKALERFRGISTQL